MSVEMDLISEVKQFNEELKASPNHRWLSWSYCYFAFHQARKAKTPNVDYLSLQLAFYLASWGMYRGLSFLLQCDYRVHIPMVEEILKPEYDCLLSLDCKTLLENDGVLNTLQKLNQQLSKLYAEARQNAVKKMPESAISSILISKVLLGTLACLPAYDGYFIKALKHTKAIKTSLYGKNSWKQLAQFYQEHFELFETERKKLQVGQSNLPYPQMKFLDVGFWQMTNRRLLQEKK